MDRWEYLHTKTYAVRHHVAEYYLDDVDVVVDVGTYKRKLETVATLHCVDPLRTFPDTFHGTVSEWCAKHGGELDGKRVATVVLGLHVEGGEVEFGALVKLLKRSSVVVVEFPKQHRPSQEQFDRILVETGLVVGNEIVFKMRKVDTVGHPPFAERTLYTLSRG